MFSAVAYCARWGLVASIEIEVGVKILQYQGKGAHLSTIEQYFTYKEFSKNNHLNDEFNITPNKIFDAFLKPHQP